ncbi:MAG: hypothetical protein LBG97_08580 [Coriobacteriales bacterium]|jgi:hypothetical protein|nr:hypothetical protein [Coriobacteriales bacterium]
MTPVDDASSWRQTVTPVDDAGSWRQTTKEDDKTDDNLVLSFVQKLAKQGLVQADEYLEDICKREALVADFVNYLHAQSKLRGMKRKLTQELFFGDTEQFLEYLRLRDQPMNTKRSYFVVITRIDDAKKSYNWDEASDSVRQHLIENGAADVIDIGIDTGFVHIFPDNYALDKNDVVHSTASDGINDGAAITFITSPIIRSFSTRNMVL